MSTTAIIILVYVVTCYAYACSVLFSGRYEYPPGLGYRYLSWRTTSEVTFLLLAPIRVPFYIARVWRSRS